jgi:hypothetical protein
MKELDIVFHERRPYLLKIAGVEIHQEIDFFLRPFPVLYAERIQSQVFDADFDAVDSGFFDRFSALLMPPESGQVLFCGPSAITVHDNRDMARHLGGIHTKSLGGLQAFFFETLTQNFTIKSQ